MKIDIIPVGVSFPDSAPNIKLLKVGSEVSFSHQPAFYGSGDKRKEYPNAIVILFNDKKVGSLAESDLIASPQQTILRMIKAGETPKGIVTELIIPKETDTFKQTYKLSVEVPETLETNVSTNVKKVSFNEGVEVYFDPVSHTYTKDDKPLTSCSAYTKKFFSGFDVDNISKVSAKSWGVGQQEVVDLWDSNSMLSAQFGTFVHQGLEHYDRFKELGAKISEKKGLDYNYALPKHPIIRKIIEDFIKIEKTKGKIIPEALLSDVKNGLCGHADRIEVIDAGKKICRVGDYKVNVDSSLEDKRNKLLPPFDYLPANKLSVYQVKMSFYANLLQRSGWTVLGLDAYVFEDEWKHYELEVLQVIE